jgi:hypothetical protein
VTRWIVVAGLLALGCSVASRAVAAGPARCVSITHAASLPPHGSILTANVRGGPAREEVYLAGAPKASSGCGIFLIVRGDGGAEVARVPPFLVGTVAESFGAGLPRLVGLLRLGGSRFAEPVVEIEKGAHAFRYAAYASVTGRLIRVKQPRGFAFTADIGMLDRGGVDCDTRTRTLRSYFAEQEAVGRWRLATIRVRLQGASFQTVSHTTGLVSLRTVANEQRHYADAPLGTCPGVFSPIIR